MFYNEINRTRIDSLQFYGWDENEEVWSCGSSCNVIYNASNGCVSEVNYHEQNESYLIGRKLCYYDNQNRLIKVESYSLDDDGDVLIISYKMVYVYGENQLNQRIYRDYMLDNGTFIERITYNNDNLGRIISATTERSVDSLNWDITWTEQRTYHENDASTGASHLYYLSHYQEAKLWKNVYYEPFGMIGTRTFYQGNGMVYSGIYNYSYNDNNQLTGISGYYIDYVANQARNYRDSLYYDLNNNLIRDSAYSWDDVGLFTFDTQYQYNWEQYHVANLDETAPEINSVLSAYPNPFRNKVNINIASKDIAPYTAAIYNIKGQLVKQFTQQKGKSLVWDGKDDADNPVGNGIYLIKVNQNGSSEVKKIIRIK